MAQHHDDVANPHDQSATVSDSEKAGVIQDNDASSGNVEAQIPGADAMAVDKMTERAILRKLDYRIVPMVMWVYLMNMMDRGMNLTTRF